MEPSRHNYTLISADSHAGAEIRDYRPYLASEFHEEFDEWVENFRDTWVVLPATLFAHGSAGLVEHGSAVVVEYGWLIGR